MGGGCFSRIVYIASGMGVAERPGRVRMAHVASRPSMIGNQFQLHLIALRAGGFGRGTKLGRLFLDLARGSLARFTFEAAQGSATC